MEIYIWRRIGFHSWSLGIEWLRRKKKEKSKKKHNFFVNIGPVKNAARYEKETPWEEPLRSYEPKRWEDCSKIAGAEDAGGA